MNGDKRAIKMAETVIPVDHKSVPVVSSGAMLLAKNAAYTNVTMSVVKAELAKSYVAQAHMGDRVVGESFVKAFLVVEARM
jgi:hypothetical protein